MRIKQGGSVKSWALSRPPPYDWRNLPSPGTGLELPSLSLFVTKTQSDLFCKLIVAAGAELEGESRVGNYTAIVAAAELCFESSLRT